MDKNKIDVLFAVIAQREVEFFSDVADFFKDKHGVTVAFLTFFEPGDAYLEKKGYRVFSLHKNVDFRGVILDDSVIKGIEEKYAIGNIRTLLLHEKLTFNRFHEERLFQKLIAYDKYFDRVISDNKISNVVQEIGGFIAPMALYYNCKHHNVRHIFLEPSPYKGHIFLNVDSVDVNIENTQACGPQVMDAVKDYIRRYHENKTVLVPVKDRHHFIKAGIRKLLNERNMIRLSQKLYHKYIKREREEYDAILNHVKRHCSMFLKRQLLRRSYSEFESERKYIYFPLHVPLDFQLTVRESRYLDQLALIEKISNLLPFGYDLYIKEHPASVGGYDYSMLKKVLRSRNVKFIKPDVNSYDLIRNSVCVMTINSKVGAEALMQGKGVIVLGNTYYAHSKKSVFLTNIQDLQNINFNAIDSDIKVDCNFLCKVYMNSYKGELYVRDRENISELAGSLKIFLKSN